MVLPGYHLYRMDYQKLIKAHRSSKADITITALSSNTSKDSQGFGFVAVNSCNQVIEFTGELGEERRLNFASVSVFAISNNHRQSMTFAHRMSPALHQPSFVIRRLLFRDPPYSVMQLVR